MKKMFLFLAGSLIAGVSVAQYKVEWTNNPANVTVNANNTLTRSPNVTTFDGGGANSFNVLATGDGSVEFTIQAGNANSYGIGFSASTVTTHTLAIIDYAFVLDNGALTIREKNSPKKTVTFASGNVLRISKIGSQVIYYKNGAPEYTSLTAPTGAYMVNASIRAGTSPIPTVSFLAPLMSSRAVVPLDGTESGRGETHFTVRGGLSPFTYLWADGVQGSDRTGMFPGIYTATVKDANGSQNLHYFPVGYKAFWQRLGTSTTVNADNSLMRTIAAGGYTTGASSENKLVVGRDGWVGFVCEAPGTNKYFVEFSDTDEFYSIEDYAVVNSLGILQVYYGGLKKYEDTNTANTLKAGEFVRLERKNGIVSCYRNATLIYTFDQPSTTDVVVGVGIGAARTPVIMCSFAKAGSRVPPEYRPDDNIDRNWTFATSYDDKGNVTGQTKVFYDLAGQPDQLQAKDLVSGNIFAAQTLYDAMGREAVTTLAAPIDNAAFNYRDKFVADGTGQAYTSLNFDGAKLNAPDPLGNTQSGTLGYYFSTKNVQEPNTPTTAYPYVRTVYDDQPSGVVKRVGGAGDQFRMGAGHETQGLELPVLTELDHYRALRDHFVDTDPGSFAFQGTKMVSVDANGKEVVTFGDKEGRVVASCTSGSAYAGFTVTAELEESPTCFFAARHIRQQNENDAVLALAAYLEVYDVDNNYAVLFKGAPDSSLRTLLPYDRELEFRSDQGFVILFFRSIFSFTGVTPLPIAPENIVPRKNFLDLHISAGTAAEAITITGTGNSIKAYNRMTDQVVYDGAASGLTTLPPGLYRLVTTQPGATTFQVSYTLHYGDFSYQYYDDAGNVVAVVPPNGVDRSSTVYPAFVTRYSYNSSGQMLSATTPDDGLTEYVYRKDGSIRFSQNAQQRMDHKFSYSNYDRRGRIVQSGEYLMFTTAGAGQLFENQATAAPATNSVLNAAVLENIQRTGGLDVARCTVLGELWYDTPFTDAPLNGRMQEFVLGQVAKTKNSDATTWYSYDEGGRVTWTVQNITGLGTKVVQYTYDDAGNITQVAYQPGAADKFYHHYTYDANQRLKEVYTSLDGTTRTLRAKYDYYLHGPLKRVALESSLQGIDYVYTIDGALKSINHADKTKDPGGDTNDVFGMTFQYHPGDYQGAGYSAGSFSSADVADQYTGLAKAINWLGAANIKATSTYLFAYDGKYQMKEARFGTMNIATPYTFQPDPLGDFKENISQYDANGNIQSLQRSGLHVGLDPHVLADYNYVYEPGTNRLDRVDRNGAQAIELKSNAIGQTTDKSVDGNVTHIVYDASGLVTTATDEDGHTLASYRYDDHGNKIRQTTYSNGTAVKDTWYVHDATGALLAVYEQPLPGGTPALREVPIYGEGRLATFKPAVNTYFYEVNDHLGNVRAVIGKPQTQTVSATFENNSTAAELANFPTSYKRVGADLYDHTDAGTTYTYSHLLNGGYNGQVGMAKSFDVSPGDVLKVDVYSKYEGTIGSPGNFPAFSMALVTAFGLSATSPGEMARAYQALTEYGDCIVAGICSPDTDPAADPRGFMTILVFDKNYNLVEAAFDKIDALYSQTGGTKKPFDLLTKQVTIKEPGYAYVYLSNEGINQQNIYFDDLLITHTHSAVVAGADYYPFGLPLEGREITREPYRFGYQGQSSEKNDTTRWSEFDLRMYDPDLGRWLSADVYGQHASPFMAMGNDPSNRIDLDGGTDFVNRFGVVIGNDGINNGKSILVWRRKDIRRIRSQNRTQVGELSSKIFELPTAEERIQLMDLWNRGLSMDDREFTGISFNGRNGGPGSGLIMGEGQVWTPQGGNAHANPTQSVPLPLGNLAGRYDLGHTRITAHTHNVDFKKYSINQTTGDYKTGANKPSPNDYYIGQRDHAEINLVLQTRTGDVAVLNSANNTFVTMAAKYFFLNFRNNTTPLRTPTRGGPRYQPSRP